MNKLIASYPTYATDEYSIFKTLQGNRGLNKTQVKKLTKVLATDPEMTRFNPIKVNEHLEVIDGQHRLAAHQAYAEAELTVPIHYMIVDGLTVDNARVLNSGQKPWSPDNYAATFAHSGNKNYQTYINFRKVYGLNHDIMVRYLSPSGGYDLQTFKSGDFKVEDEKKSDLLCERLTEIGSYLPTYFWKHRGFALSYLDVALSANYDHERMIEQMDQHAGLLNGVALKNTEIIPKLNQIFNKGQEDKQHLV